LFKFTTIFVSTRHQKIVLFCSMVIWQKKNDKKTKMEICQVFFWNLSFFKEVCFSFFSKVEGAICCTFFSFLEVVTAYSYVTGKKLFWIFFRFKFRKFRFWFLMLHQCIEREPDDFTYFLLWYVFFDCWWFFLLIKSSLFYWDDVILKFISNYN